jgi:hypothetical protein
VTCLGAGDTIKVVEDVCGSGSRNVEAVDVVVVVVGPFDTVSSSSFEDLMDGFISKSWNRDVVDDKWLLDRDLDGRRESQSLPSI